jgi:hypothetical protein
MANGGIYGDKGSSGESGEEFENGMRG